MFPLLAPIRTCAGRHSRVAASRASAMASGGSSCARGLSHSRRRHVLYCGCGSLGLDCCGVCRGRGVTTRHRRLLRLCGGGRGATESESGTAIGMESANGISRVHCCCAWARACACGARGCRRTRCDFVCCCRPFPPFAFSAKLFRSVFFFFFFFQHSISRRDGIDFWLLFTSHFYRFCTVGNFRRGFGPLFTR